MLITPRTYSASQIPDRGITFSAQEDHPRFHSLSGWCTDSANARRAAEMLLLHQTGSVRVGEVVRYTLTYTPEADPIQPIPRKLYVKVKNTSAIPLRAAYLHGPYTLYASCYPSTFDTNVKYDQEDIQGSPQFEPYLKAGGNWDAVITVPEDLYQQSKRSPTPTNTGCHRSVTWIIEIVSQVIFSGTAAVHFELLVGRDERSLAFISAGGVIGHGVSQPAQLDDHWSSNPKGKQVLATKGVYSKSVKLLVDDTVSLWNTPPFPSFQKEHGTREAGLNRDVWTQNIGSSSEDDFQNADNGPRKSAPKKKNIHLVVLTHGLHSNLCADMLYLKESIDTAVKNSREQSMKNRKKTRGRRSFAECTKAPNNCTVDQSANEDDSQDDDSDDEEVMVRGFPGNAVRTERGIQYLGKRLAKYVLLMTYPDQPYFPLKNSKQGSFSRPLAVWKNTMEQPLDTSAGPKENQQDYSDRAYRVTSISFIGHSLGGLVQTYAIAYIQKYSPQFFELIRPVNFIALATPFLGLSNENPMYVRFALDLGLVGRTGQDLGLSWTAPKVRSGWGAIIGGKGSTVETQAHTDPGSKPLLRILPCGPAHDVLVKFQHRTIYSNVVNDGIVPLRTSCLLFLDWKGLDRVEKARRGNGIVGTMAEWGWAELTGANSKSPETAVPAAEVASGDAQATVVTQGAEPNGLANSVDFDDIPSSPLPSQFLKQPQYQESHNTSMDSASKGPPQPSTSSPLSSLLSIFRPKETKSSQGNKQPKIYKRSQTLGASGESIEVPSTTEFRSQGIFTRENSYDEAGVHTPPKTTLFESASDLLMPPLPPIQFIINPASRPRTIFHDRIYRPEDIPPPQPVQRRTLTFGSSQSKSPKQSSDPTGRPDKSQQSGSQSGLKFEEKIARAYHRDLTWRKVLVRLEPDAHNNIIVRRMFTNAYGWPVVKHLVDTHFGHTHLAQSSDNEMSWPPRQTVTGSGKEETVDQTDSKVRVQSPRHYRDGLLETAACERQISSEHLSHFFQSGSNDEGAQNPLGLDVGSNASVVSGGDSARFCDHGFDDDDDGESEFGDDEGMANHMVGSRTKS